MDCDAPAMQLLPYVGYTVGSCRLAGVPIGRRSENKCWPKSSGLGPNNDGTRHAASACICFEIDLVSADKNNHDNSEIDLVSADKNNHDNIDTRF